MTKVPRACTTCRLLPNCKFVTEKMIETGDYCGDWCVATEADLDARNSIIDGLGPAALRYEVKHLNQRRARVKPRRRRRHV